MSSDFYYMTEKGETSIVICAYSSFEIGKNYLVYADLFENQLQVHECSRTQVLNKAERDVKELEELGAPVNAQPRLISGVDISMQWRNPTKPCS